MGEAGRFPHAALFFPPPAFPRPPLIARYGAGGVSSPKCVHSRLPSVTGRPFGSAIPELAASRLSNPVLVRRFLLELTSPCVQRLVAKPNCSASLHHIGLGPHDRGLRELASDCRPIPGPASRPFGNVERESGATPREPECLTRRAWPNRGRLLDRHHPTPPGRPGGRCIVRHTPRTADSRRRLQIFYQIVFP